MNNLTVMDINIAEELKNLDKEQELLKKRREELQEKLEAQAEERKKLEAVYENSGFPSPRALIKALMVHYGVKVTGAAAEGKRRKRTKVTPELVAQVKAAVNEEGLSKNQAAKRFEISYAVVTKMITGGYDS